MGTADVACDVDPTVKVTNGDTSAPGARPNLAPRGREERREEEDRWRFLAERSFTFTYPITLDWWSRYRYGCPRYEHSGRQMGVSCSSDSAVAACVWSYVWKEGAPVPEKEEDLWREATVEVEGEEGAEGKAEAAKADMKKAGGIDIDVRV